MADPMSWFFSLGDKATKGDPLRKANFDFYLLIIMFLAFTTILFDNLYAFFFVTQRFSNLGWSFVMLAILWFQYFGLKSMYDYRKMLKESFDKSKSENVDTMDDMLKSFNLN